MTCKTPKWPISLFPYSATIPQFYLDSKSEQAVIARLCEYLNVIEEYVTGQTDKINEVVAALNGLAEEFGKFKESGFADYYEDLLAKWIDENMPAIISRAMKNVWFGLTDDGYFCAYIPQSWSDITFDTGSVYGTEQYGRLILRYFADGRGIIDNTAPDYSEQWTDADNERLTKLEKTVYTPISVLMQQSMRKAKNKNAD